MEEVAWQIWLVAALVFLLVLLLIFSLLVARFCKGCLGHSRVSYSVSSVAFSRRRGSDSIRLQKAIRIPERMLGGDVFQEIPVTVEYESDAGEVLL